MSLLKEREDLVAKHEKLKAEHKVNVDKAKIRAHALGTNPLASERLSDQSEVSALDNPVFTRPPPKKAQHHHSHAPTPPQPPPELQKRGSAAFKLHEIALKQSSQTMPVRSHHPTAAPPSKSAAFAAMQHAMGQQRGHGAKGGDAHGAHSPSAHAPPPLSRPEGSAAAGGAPVLHWSPHPEQVDMMIQDGAVTPASKFFCICPLRFSRYFLLTRILFRTTLNRPSQ